MEQDYDKTVELLLDAPYWVIDFLPWQVPEGDGGQFFAVERFFMEGPGHERLCRQFADVLLRLNCYHDLVVNCGPCGCLVKNPEPATLVAWLKESLRHGHLCILLEAEQALITANSGDTNLTLHNPSPALLELVGQLSNASGLFLWRPQ